MNRHGYERVSGGMMTEGTSKANEVFESPEALKPSYRPKELPHRDEQVKKTASVLVSALRSKTPPNILMYGRSGTGKTATSRYVGRELESAGRRFGVDCSVVHINCTGIETRHGVLRRLATQLGLKVHEKDLPTDRVYDAVVDRVGSYRRVVIVLDEVDRLVEKSGDGVPHSLSRMNRDLDESRVSLICVYDDAGFTEIIDTKLRSSLCEEEVYFPSYTANQLRDILRPRAETAFADGAVSDDVVPVCAAFAAREGGDAGYAIDLLRTAGELSSEGCRVTREDVQRARDRLRPGRQRHVKGKQ